MIPRDLVPHFRQRQGQGIILARAQFDRAVNSPQAHDLAVTRFEQGDAENGRRREWVFDWHAARFESESMQEVVDDWNYWTMYLMAQDFREAR